MSCGRASGRWQAKAGPSCRDIKGIGGIRCSGGGYGGMSGKGHTRHRRRTGVWGKAQVGRHK